jgi:hypothetical protein
MFRKIRSKLTLKQKYIIKYFLAMFEFSHIRSLLLFFEFPNDQYGATKEIWKSFKPKKITCELKRVGGYKDGGYLIPDINHEYDGLISPGIGNSVSFELDFVGEVTKAVLIDATVPKPTELPRNMIYLGKMLSSESSEIDSQISLQDVRNQFFPNSRSLALQMDIEGSEYEILTRMSPGDFYGIDLILVEFHNLHKMTGQGHQDNPLIASLKVLSEVFQLVHTHPNNAGGFSLFRFRVMPKVVETTWVRKHLVSICDEVVGLPHEHDVPNDPLIWDLNSPTWAMY